MREFKYGETACYAKDYPNLGRSIEISSREFKELIESNFPNLEAPISKIKEKEHVLVVNEKREGKRHRNFLINKCFICIKEASATEKGLVIGIHDYSTFKKEIDCTKS